MSKLHGCKPASLLETTCLRRRKLTSNFLLTARTNQGRSSRGCDILHCVFRRMVPRSLNYRSSDRTLPLPTGNLLERVCSVDCDRSWRSTESPRSLLGDGKGFRCEMFGEASESKTNLRSTPRAFTNLFFSSEHPLNLLPTMNRNIHGLKMTRRRM